MFKVFLTTQKQILISITVSWLQSCSVIHCTNKVKQALKKTCGSKPVDVNKVLHLYEKASEDFLLDPRVLIISICVISTEFLAEITV